MILGALIGGGASLLGGLLDSSGSPSKAIKKAMKFNDQTASGQFGSVFTGRDGTNRFAANQQTTDLRNQLGGQVPGLLGGGQFNNAAFQQGFQGAQQNFGGAVNQADQAFQQQAGNTAFGGLPGLFGQAGGLGQMFAQQTAGGPQDFSGGLQGALFGQGAQNFLNAGNQQGLFDQSLASQRAAAQPQQDRQFNRLQDRLFATGQLGSTGGAQQLEGLFNSQAQQDLGFQNNAFGQALAQGQFLGGLGGQQIGLGQNFLGQNLGQFNQGAQNAFNFGGQAAGFEGQQFGQSLQGLQQNQSAGLNRLNAATSALGFGNDLQASQSGLGLQQAGFLQGLDQFQLNSILGLRGAETDRIAAATGGAQGLARAGGDGLGSLIASAGNTIGGLFNQPQPSSGVTLAGANQIRTAGGT